MPVLIPPLDPGHDADALERIFRRARRVLFPSSVDIHPTRCGKKVHPTITVDEPLDALELRLARWASEHEVTTLGCVAGQQVLDVALGGWLIPDLPSAAEHPQSDAAVRQRPGSCGRRAPGSRLAPIFGENELRREQLPSPGGQAARARPEGGRPGPPDGVVEASRAPSVPGSFADQFHPGPRVSHPRAEPQALRGVRARLRRALAVTVAVGH